MDRGYVAREPFDGRAASIKVTPLGYAFLQQNGLSGPSSSPRSEHPCVHATERLTTNHTCASTTLEELTHEPEQSAMGKG